ncbi:MAG TPA: hypothetical protein DCQ83_04345 [Fibrobacteres bacterium]|nr:hypothetical protein [Fibrobacterota bacterium]
MNTSSARNKLAAARFRAEAVSRIRNFFASRNVLEVETPLLSQGASHDYHIDLFPVDTGETSPRFLQTSPEPHMKRLLARGYPDIFQIGKSFRKGEKGNRHNPEFTMVEWYRRGYALNQMMDETVELCQLITGPKPVVHATYADAFSKVTGLDPLSSTLNELVSHPGIAQRELPAATFPSVSDALNFLMSEVVEPQFSPEVMTVVSGFPTLLSSQALVDPKNPQTALRFEVFGGGMELGNGYQELVDVAQYRARFDAENRKRSESAKLIPPLDENWFKDLTENLPPCSGVAVGFDRLVQLGLGVGSLNEVLEFPWEEA